jgi:ergothioneine biosynthesis protein EgtB
MEALRRGLAERLADARARTDDLFGIVRPDAILDRPIPERHRILFYLGHLEAFDWNLIARSTFGRDAFHAAFDRLFAFGIDPTDGGLPSDTPSDWPAVDEVVAYNRRVRDGVDACLRAADLAGGGDAALEGRRVFDVAIEHRLMHAETLAYMLHRMPLDRKVARREPPPPEATRSAASRMVPIPEGVATLGLPRSDDAPFGWDNEFEETRVRVPAFRIDAFDVTNGEFLEFVRAGGYGERGLWTDTDWAWRVAESVEHPAFWRKGAGGGGASGAAAGPWLYRGMFTEAALPLDRPVYVSHAEASAYARWVGKALPTEAQFHCAAYGAPGGVAGAPRAYPWGDEPPDARRGNFDFHRWDPVPVGAFPSGDSAFGVADLLGNGWEWTSTVFEPFPGFRPFPFYPGYSADFFDGKHIVMKGGSARTAACLLRATFRNWFQPRYPYVYAAFRCVEA